MQIKEQDNISDAQYIYITQRVMILILGGSELHYKQLKRTFNC